MPGFLHSEAIETKKYKIPPKPMTLLSTGLMETKLTKVLEIKAIFDVLFSSLKQNEQSSVLLTYKLINKGPVNTNYCSAVCKLQCLSSFSTSKLFALVIRKQMVKLLKQSLYWSKKRGGQAHPYHLQFEILTHNRLLDESDESNLIANNWRQFLFYYPYTGLVSRFVKVQLIISKAFVLAYNLSRN